MRDAAGFLVCQLTNRRRHLKGAIKQEIWKLPESAFKTNSVLPAYPGLNRVTLYLLQIVTFCFDK